MSNNASEFPCVEATRCLLTEVEMGLRLTVNALPNGTKRGYSNDLQNSHTVAFSKRRSPKQEWYLHLDPSRGGSDGKGSGKHRHSLQLRHSESGQYLSCDETGRVNCAESSSPSTYWWLEPVHEMESPETATGLSSTSGSFDESTEGQYILTSKKYPSRRLTYTADKFGASDDGIQLIASNKSEPSVWTIKFTSGELCFISNPVVHCQLRCNTGGTISLNSGSHGWEVFRFIEVGNGELYISSWTHYTRFLTSDTDGKVTSIDSTSRDLSYSERWRIEVPEGGRGLYIQNVASRRYLSVGREANEQLWTTTKPNDYALWHLNAAHSHIYYLTSLFASTKNEKGVDESSKDSEEVPEVEDEVPKDEEEKPEVEEDIPKSSGATDYNQIYSKRGVSDMHISSSKNGPFLTKKKQKWEEWQIELTPEGDVTFFSIAHEKYLGCNSKGDVHTTTSKGAWTLWEKKISPNGGVMFLSREHLRFLAVSDVDGSLHTTPGDEETNLCHSWRMDPRLPRSISGGKIAGAMGLAMAVAMPFAVLGAIETVGAAATEIAILGTSVEVLAGAVAGAALGAGVVGTTAKLVSNGNGKEQSNGDDDDLLDKKFACQRPLSAWKKWIEKQQPSSASPPPNP